jgi:hypothetical protein
MILVLLVACCLLLVAGCWLIFDFNQGQGIFSIFIFLLYPSLQSGSFAKFAQRANF